jgi:hypothetical protein
MKMSVRRGSWKRVTDRRVSLNFISLTRKALIYSGSKENLSDEKNQETSPVGVEPNFFKSGAEKSEGLENLPSSSPAPAA